MNKSKSSAKAVSKPLRNQAARRKGASSKRDPVSKGKGLHPRNLHQSGYDFPLLIQAYPKLKPFVRPTPYGQLSIDFGNPLAVKALNAALLKKHYHIDDWDIPAGFLCPPIPGRVDYLHYLADLLAEDVSGDQDAKMQAGRIRGLDIGTGANGIYPLLGIESYGWQFVASDVDPISIDNVNRLIDNNTPLQGKLALRLQLDSSMIFNGIIQEDERFDFSMCNPPFHRSLAEASEGSQRKLTNLARNRGEKAHNPKPNVEVKAKSTDISLNFGGQKAELWCEGGEARFLANMIAESRLFSGQVMWFTSLVSKSDNLKACYYALTKAGADTVKTIEMTQGNKITRILAWSYLTPELRRLWAKSR